MISLHETCQQYVLRRLSEGWRIISQKGFNVVLQSPDGNILRPVDLRNDVETLRPNAAGDVTAITGQYPSSTYHWDKVDEASPDADSTYVYTEGGNYNNYDLYNLPAHSVGSGVINFILVYMRAREVSGSGYCRINIKTGGTEYFPTGSSALTTSYANYSYQWNTNPKTTIPWTWSDIDALQIGGEIYNTSGVGYFSRCTQIYVEVNFTPPFTPFRSYYPHILAH